MSSTILLADDSLTIQKVVELTFADTEFTVVAVSSGEELLQKLPATAPDIVICDVIMPGTDGYDVCQRIKSDPATLHIPVILLTGTFEPFDRDRALAAGSSEIITKPFEARKLVETVEHLLGFGSGAPATAPAPPPQQAAPQPPAPQPPAPQPPAPQPPAPQAPAQPVQPPAPEPVPFSPPPVTAPLPSMPQGPPPSDDDLDFTTTGFAEMRAAGEKREIAPPPPPDEGLEFDLSPEEIAAAEAQAQMELGAQTAPVQAGAGPFAQAPAPETPPAPKQPEAPMAATPTAGEPAVAPLGGDVPYDEGGVDQPFPGGFDEAPAFPDADDMVVSDGIGEAPLDPFATDEPLGSDEPEPLEVSKDEGSAFDDTGFDDAGFGDPELDDAGLETPTGLEVPLGFEEPDVEGPDAGGPELSRSELESPFDEPEETQPPRVETSPSFEVPEDLRTADSQPSDAEPAFEAAMGEVELERPLWETEEVGASTGAAPWETDDEPASEEVSSWDPDAEATDLGSEPWDDSAAEGPAEAAVEPSPWDSDEPAAADAGPDGVEWDGGVEPLAMDVDLPETPVWETDTAEPAETEIDAFQLDETGAVDDVVDEAGSGDDFGSVDDVVGFAEIDDGEAVGLEDAGVDDDVYGGEIAEAAAPPWPDEAGDSVVAAEPADAFDEVEPEPADEQPPLTAPVVPHAPEPTAPIQPAAAVSGLVSAPGELSDEDVDRIAHRVLELARDTIEKLAWEVIPDMAELVVRERLRDLERELEAGSDEPQADQPLQ